MGDSGNAKERRIFSRVRCDQIANYRLGDRYFPCKLIDLSLNGALFEIAEELQVHPGDRFQLELPYEPPAAVVLAEAVVVHVRGRRVGCRFDDIDTTSTEFLQDMIMALVSREGRPRG